MSQVSIKEQASQQVTNDLILFLKQLNNMPKDDSKEMLEEQQEALSDSDSNNVIKALDYVKDNQGVEVTNSEILDNHGNVIAICKRDSFLLNPPISENKANNSSEEINEQMQTMSKVRFNNTTEDYATKEEQRKSASEDSIQSFMNMFSNAIENKAQATLQNINDSIKQQQLQRQQMAQHVSNQQKQQMMQAAQQNIARNNNLEGKKDSVMVGNTTINYKNMVQPPSFIEAFRFGINDSPHENLSNLAYALTNEIKHLYGDWSRINSLFVVDCQVIINNICWRPDLSQLADNNNFPVDTIDYLKGGAIAELLDWSFLEN